MHGLEHGKLFEHCFWYSPPPRKKDPLTQINNWCCGHCSGQWMVIGGSRDSSYDSTGMVSITVLSGAKNQPPDLMGEMYPPSKISRKVVYIITFECEEDATAFKLALWDSDNDDTK